MILGLAKAKYHIFLNLINSFRIKTVLKYGRTTVPLVYIVFRVKLQKLSLVGGLPSFPSHDLLSVYMKNVAHADWAKTWPSWALSGSRMIYMSQLVTVRWSKVFIWRKLALPLGSPYLQSEWPSTHGHPASQPNFVISHVNAYGSLLFIKKCMKSFFAWGGSVWRVTLLPGSTFLHVDRPLEKNAKQVLRSLRQTLTILNK